MTHYLAAPLASPTRGGRRRHRDRAILAGRILGATVVPHRDIAPLYVPGYPEEDETPEQRAAAMAECLSVVARADVLTVLLHHDWTYSPGCLAELRTWQATHPDAPHPTAYRWEDLIDLAIAAGVHDEWYALR